ncbi:MAG: alpha/beta hydrolase [Gemmatimonadaceae bacterium]
MHRHRPPTFVLHLLSIATALSAAPPARAQGSHSRTGVVPNGPVNLAYYVEGSGRDTLLVLHGGPGLDAGYIRPDLAPLLKDLTLIFYDQRGTGGSTVVTDPAQLTLEAHLADVEAVRKFFAIERVSILGHSWGAALGAHYARTAQAHVRRLLLVDAMPARATPWGATFGTNLRTWMDQATRLKLVQLAKARDTSSDVAGACRAYWHVFIRGYFSDPGDTAMIARMHGDPCTAPPAAFRNGKVVSASTLNPLGDWDWRTQFQDVQVPVLIVHGALDPIPAESAAEWKTAFPDARLELIPGAGHFSYVERPKEFVKVVRDFLKSSSQ